MGLAQAFVELFSYFSLVAIFPIVIGLVLMITEMYRYSRRVFTIVGASLIALGVIFRSLASFNVAALLILLSLIATILLVAHLIKLRVQKQEWLYQSIRNMVGKTKEE